MWRIFITSQNTLWTRKEVRKGLALWCLAIPCMFAKYLGVTLSGDLSWGAHVNNISKKANQILGFLKYNIKVHKHDLKSTAYKTFVRPQLEYASTVWSPHTVTDIQKIESVQRRAARWATRDYRYTSSVTSVLNNLNWRPLDQTHRLSPCHIVVSWLSNTKPYAVQTHPLFSIQTDTHTQELL